MFEKLFKKHKSEEDNFNVSRTEIKCTEIKKTEIPIVEPEEIKIKYTLIDTGETIEFSYDDDEAFDKMMTSKSAKILFR